VAIQRLVSGAPKADANSSLGACRKMPDAVIAIT
jgi:hypothetical protein